MISLRTLFLFVAVLTAATQAQALCLICQCNASTTSVNFGAYNPIGGSAATGTGNVEVSCSGTLGVLLSLNITLSKGTNGSDFSDRKMASGTSRLQYQLYSNASHSTVWGDGSGGTINVGTSLLLSILGALSVSNPVYGVLPANQTSAKAGTYTDTASVVVTYN